ncbi:MAG: hypothetical protein K0R75_2077 [Paenibacillaceae bacterium]|jgi:hypothetical protein|nr:hypothetical protein [Paenibacillaceae bacterium]
MKKLLIFVLLLASLAYIGKAAAFRYIAPTDTHDLSYSEISIAPKIVDMVKNRQFAATLTEADVNSLLKQALARHPQLNDEVTVTGADFHLDGSRLTADLNLLYHGNIPIGATCYFQLSAAGSVLTATYDGATVKAIAIPPAWVTVPPLEIDLNEYMPSLVGIDRIDFAGTGVTLHFALR